MMFILFVAVAIFISGVVVGEQPHLAENLLDSHLYAPFMLLLFAAVIDLWWWRTRKRLDRIEKLLRQRPALIVNNDNYKKEKEAA